MKKFTTNDIKKAKIILGPEIKVLNSIVRGLNEQVVELVNRAESAEAMLVDMQDQLESVKISRDYFVQLSEDRFAEAGKAYELAKQREKERDWWKENSEMWFIKCVEAKRGWCERLLDRMEAFFEKR